MHSLTRHPPLATRHSTPISHLPSPIFVFLAIAGRLLARFDLSDQIRSTSFSAMHSLRALGINVELLTGDHPDIDQSVKAGAEAAR